MEKEEKSIQAFHNKSHIRLLCITYRQRKTNDYIHEKMINLIGKYEPLLSTIKCRKLKYYGHICRHDGLAKKISIWTDRSTSELSRMTEDREKWKKLVVDTCLMIPPTIQESME